MRPIDKTLKGLTPHARKQIYYRFRGALEIRPDCPEAKELTQAGLMEELDRSFFWRSGRVRHMPTLKGFEAFKALHDGSHQRHLDEASVRQLESERHMVASIPEYGMF